MPLTTVQQQGLQAITPPTPLLHAQEIRTPPETQPPLPVYGPPPPPRLAPRRRQPRGQARVLPLFEIEARKFGVIIPQDFEFPPFNIPNKHLDSDDLLQVRKLHKDLHTAAFEQRVYDRLKPLPVFPHNGTAKQRQEVKMDYAIRRFEIDIATMVPLICDCCGVLDVAGGVFSRKYGTGKFPSSRNPVKFVYQFADGTYKYLHPRQLEEGVESEKMETVCRCCLNDTN